MNCEEFKAVKDRYLQGAVTPAEESQIEKHLENCLECQAMVDKAVVESENPTQMGRSGTNDNICMIDEKKQQKILRRAKYKNRFSMALFLLGLFILLNIIGTLLSGLYFNWGEEAGRLYRTQKTAALLTEFTFPNVTVPAHSSPFPLFFTGAGWGHSSLEVKPYFATHGNYAMQKRIGKENYVIGHLNINQFFSSMNVNWQWQDNSFNDYLYFVHPEQLNMAPSGVTSGNISNHAEPIWQALETLPAGTVAEMSVSLAKTYSIAEVKNLLADYDLDITWYAISTGLETNPHYPEDRQAPLSAFRGVWGLSDLTRNRLSEHSPISTDDSLVREQYVLESMDFLIQNEQTAKRIYRGEPETLQIPARYAYIKEHGINVYGLVVTGPTKELLKLKDIEVIHSPGLGEVKLWNWFNRNFQGEMY